MSTTNKYGNRCRHSKVSHYRGHSRRQAPRKKKLIEIQNRPFRRETNRFQTAIAFLAAQYGYDVHEICARSKSLSSSDFCLDHKQSFEMLPGVICSDLRAQFGLKSNSPYIYLHGQQKWDILHDRLLVYIPSKLTTEWTTNRKTIESFDTAQRLYQYLNWTIRISKMARTMVLLRGQNKCTVMLTHCELHDERGRDLYALCIPNDVVSRHSQKWQLAALLTGCELVNLLSIKTDNLPYGVRTGSGQFNEYRNLKANDARDHVMRVKKEEILKLDAKCKPIRYQQMKCVQTMSRARVNVLEIGLSALHEIVRSALQNDNVPLIPMVSILVKRYKDCRRKDFSVDYLLPIRIGESWIGVVYRDGAPTQALMDDYDIANKALLCDPTFDVRSVAMMKNAHYNRLRVVSDEDVIVNDIESEHCEPGDLPTLCYDHQHSGCVTSTVPKDTPTPSLSPELELSPVPTISTLPSWTPNFNDLSNGYNPYAIAAQIPNTIPDSKSNPVISPTLNTQVISPAVATPSAVNTASGFQFVQYDVVPSPPATTAPVAMMAIPVAVPVVPVLVQQPQPVKHGALKTPGGLDTDELLQWMDQILIQGEQNQNQFQQFLSPRTNP